MIEPRPDFNDLLVNAMTETVERALPKIAKLMSSRFMSMRSVATYLDVSMDQARDLLKEWGIEGRRYTPGGFRYFERADLEAAVERHTQRPAA